MTIDLYIDPETNDLAIENNTIRLTQTLQESSRQQCSISLRTFRGEWVYNTEAGIPYLANDNNPIQLLGKVNKGVIDAYIKEDILARENITKIVSYSSSLDPVTREYTVSFTAQTNAGEIVSFENLLLV